MSSNNPHDAGAMLPLTHLSYHVMLALRDGCLHGYAIVKNVGERSGGALAPGTGTFYSALRRMLDEGVVVEVDSPTADGDDSRRRYYELTDFGREVLLAETERLQELLRWAKSEPATLG